MTVNAAPEASIKPSGLYTGFREFISSRLPSVGRVGLVALQLLVILLIISQFRLVSSGAADVLKLAGVGMVVHALLPRRWRLTFFVLLSLLALFWVLGPAAGGAVLAIGLGLIGIVHLPVAYGVRIALLVAVGALLFLLRGGWLDWIGLSWFAAVWPILGSMFMFRLIIYAYDRRHDAEPATPASTLAYFFMLPNVVFPFFPVVDYRTFRRTYYDRPDFEIYQTGIVWVLRGAFHLILYRVVYHYLIISPSEIANTGQLVQFLFTNYLLYLRVSGVFHMIIGLLHLFGFRLPETHHNWLLASSFTDYWRRINIYWKDFMMKVVYYPSFFGLRRLGPTTALVLATALVFAATAILHSYQWFWLRGDFPLHAQDMVFWSVLGLFVIVNVVWEARRGRKRTLTPGGRSRGEVFALGARTVLTLTIIVSLWSLWTSSSVTEWLAMWSVVGDGLDLGSLGSGVGAVVALVGLTAATSGGPGSSRAPQRDDVPWWYRLWAKRNHRAATAMLMLSLLLIGRPEIYRQLDAPAEYFIQSLQSRGLNQRDQATLEQGYYENLFAVDRVNPALRERYSKMPADWQNLYETEAVREPDDWRPIELRPSVSISYKGEPFRTNVWGMRDREYSRVKPEDTYRIAVTGPSTVMGSGVGDGETFEALLEAQLEHTRPSDAPRVEILNMAVESYNIPAQLALIDRIIAFDPDAWWYVAHETEFDKSIRDIAGLFANEQVNDPELLALGQEAGVEQGMAVAFSLRRLHGIEREIVQWSYERMVTAARAHGIMPVWIYIPMPVAGRGSPCPPGREALFCFGSISRPGAAAGRSDPRVAQLFTLAEDAGFHTVDLSGVYEGHELESLWIAAWDGHPNQEGHQLMSDALFDRVRADGALLGGTRAAEPGAARDSTPTSRGFR